MLSIQIGVRHHQCTTRGHDLLPVQSLLAVPDRQRDQERRASPTAVSSLTVPAPDRVRARSAAA